MMMFVNDAGFWVSEERALRFLPNRATGYGIAAIEKILFGFFKNSHTRA
jgi:hypothetical protein